MLLNAKVLKIEVKKNPAFHERTGAPHPSYFLEGTVIDLDTSQKYQCSFRDIFGAERLLKAYKDQLPETERDTIAAEVQANAKLLENQERSFTVIDVTTNKGFITLLLGKVAPFPQTDNEHLSEKP